MWGAWMNSACFNCGSKMNPEYNCPTCNGWDEEVSNKPENVPVHANFEHDFPVCERCGDLMPKDHPWQECDKCITEVFPEK